MNEGYDRVAVEDLQNMAGNKAHLLQVLDLEGDLTRVLYSPSADGDFEISEGRAWGEEASPSKGANPGDAKNTALSGIECPGVVG